MDLLQSRPDVGFGIMQCLSMILQNYTRSDSLISVISSEAYELPVNRLKPRVDTGIQYGSRRPSFYVIEDDQQLNDTMRFLSEARNFNPRAKYMVLSSNLSSISTRLFSSEFIFNIIFLDTSLSEVFTYFPNMEELVSVGFCKNGGAEIKQDPFPEKSPKRWANSTLHLMYVPTEVYAICHSCEDKGIEIEVLLMIADFFEINLDFLPLDDKTNESVLFASKAQNVLFGAQDTVDGFEWTYPYFRDVLAWFVPAPRPIPRWKFFFAVFTPRVWIFWFSTGLAITIVWVVGEILLQHRVSFEGVLVAPSLLFRWLLDQTCSYKTRYISHQLLKLNILSFSLLINFLFKSQFTFLLNGLNYQKGVDTLEEIFSNGLKIACTQWVAKTCITATNPNLGGYLGDHLVVCRGVDCLNRTAFEGDQASLQLAGVVRQAGGKFVDQGTGYRLVKRLKSPVYEVGLAAIFNRGHPMFPVFNLNLQYLVEAGIIERVASRYSNVRRTKERTLEATRSLHFDHMVAPLSMWVVGIALGAMTFVWERVVDFEGGCR